MTQKTVNINLTGKPGQTEAAVIAGTALAGTITHGNTTALFAKGTFGQIDLMATALELKEKAARVSAGDMQEAEAMLTMQAVTLDAIFTEMARRSAMNMGDYINTMEIYMRLALKAQSQCRATLETLAEMKNPRPVAFVKQANIATNQQVNNGTPSPSRTEKNKNQPNELLLEQQHHETVDTGRTPAASGTDTELETVGAKHGSKNAGRKKAIQP